MSENVNLPKTTTAVTYHIVSVDGKYCVNVSWGDEINLTKLDIDRVQHLYSYFKNLERVKSIVEKLNFGEIEFDYEDEEFFVRDNRNQGLARWEYDHSDIPQFKIIKTVRKSITTETVEEISF